MTESIGKVVILPDWAPPIARVDEAACRLCASATTVTFAGIVDNRLGTPGAYEIRRCIRCGLEQTFPVPSPPELKELYETHYNFDSLLVPAVSLATISFAV